MTSSSQMAIPLSTHAAMVNPKAPCVIWSEVRLMPWPQSSLVHAAIAAVPNVSYVTCVSDPVHDFGFWLQLLSDSHT